jgi:hypothetical protein
LCTRTDIGVFTLRSAALGGKPFKFVTKNAPQSARTLHHKNECSYLSPKALALTHRSQLWKTLPPWSALAKGPLIGLSAALLILFSGKTAEISAIITGLLHLQKYE